MKTYVKILFALFLTPFLIAGSCNSADESEDCHRRYTFINNSGRTIRLTKSVSYPDSTILDGIGVTSGITPAGEKKYFTTNGCYEFNLESGLINEHGVIMIFLFDEEIFEKYSYDEIREKRMWIKKYDMRLEDFNRMNWTITYP